MNNFFRRLPLLAKLMLIGLIPFIFLVYLTKQVYNHKTEKLQLFENYKTYLAESAIINGLIDALQEERKYTFDYVMTKSMRRQLVLQRPHTDSYIQKLTKINDPSLVGFMDYTKLGELIAMRKKVDAFNAQPNDVMHFYSNTIFRLNTLNTIPPANTPYLQPVFSHLMTHKILSEMITYLGIIRSNIYNVLYTRKYMLETLVGTIGTHDVYNSYQAELLAKAPPEILNQYKTIQTATPFKPTAEYIDTLFKKFSFDSSYTAADWWKVSDEGVNELRTFQTKIWIELNGNINKLYNAEKKARDLTLLFLLAALISVVAIISYIVFLISRSLKELRIAAEKISNGKTGLHIRQDSNDAIGSLARSISKIDQNNQVLATATSAIGNGDFSVAVTPRSPEDILGNAIAEMKRNLEQYNQKMELLVAERTVELARSNDDLQQFAHVASHDLKEPLRKIATFSNILENEQANVLSDKGKLYLQKIQQSSQRMSNMIEGVLAYSTVSVNEQPFESLNLTAILEEVESDLELVIVQKGAQINYGTLPQVSGIKLLIHQLFYNLINNALKFSKDDVVPIISISAHVVDPKTIKHNSVLKKGRYIQFDVVDNGIGFSPEYAERMFEVFSRLNSKEKYEGTGLGLALCKKIVQRHGGIIWADGEPGKGAEFHFVLKDDAAANGRHNR